MKCRFCGERDTYCFEYDNYGRGFWCEACDGYNYLKEQGDKHKFTLVLEDKAKGDNIKVRSHTPFRKRISPLRYPGGKAKLIDYVYAKLNPDKTSVFAEPYAG